MNSNQILQSGEWLKHDSEAHMICMQGYQLVGNDELDCYQGRFNRSIGRCKPSNQHFFLVLCGIRSGRN